MQILITGFTPFDYENINPACESIKNLEGIINDAQIVKREISTVFHKLIEIKRIM